MRWRAPWRAPRPLRAEPLHRGNRSRVPPRRSRFRPARCRVRSRTASSAPCRMMPQAALLWTTVITGRRITPARGVQLVEREAEGAVAGDVEHRACRVLQLQRHRTGQAEAQVAHARFVEAGAHRVHGREVVAPEGGVAAVVDASASAGMAGAHGAWPAPRGAWCRFRPAISASLRVVLPCARRACPASHCAVHLEHGASLERREQVGLQRQRPHRPACPPRAARPGPVAEGRRVDVDVMSWWLRRASAPRSSHIHDDQRQPTLRRSRRPARRRAVSPRRPRSGRRGR